MQDSVVSAEGKGRCFFLICRRASSSEQRVACRLLCASHREPIKPLTLLQSACCTLFWKTGRRGTAARANAAAAFHPTFRGCHPLPRVRQLTLRRVEALENFGQSLESCRGRWVIVTGADGEVLAPVGCFRCAGPSLGLSRLVAGQRRQSNCST
jgi:hypothetical protein